MQEAILKQTFSRTPRQCTADPTTNTLYSLNTMHHAQTVMAVSVTDWHPVCQLQGL